MNGVFSHGSDHLNYVQMVESSEEALQQALQGWVVEAYNSHQYLRSNYFFSRSLMIHDS